ncbi:MetQ/NlpA family ABC transporter substrate-binding protein [Agrococcus sp. ARC_14]|uniref:MetQ/NlpA family ABC transporter substrate-binding protein n=1 Tax=Agrococcus sp. ARC_14 TaxID=2919927 RepID=UPI001F056C39|nr:MetQ/NlpA family ABC transporter substrate-binding protein [Agrococcus sp. ARC_14]MCH1883834.1 MetQ/NlpA family ABC transporter substrate-binding protein [Agrococcus sp. ARC_14]
MSIRISRSAALVGALGVSVALAGCSATAGAGDAELGTAENPVQLGVVGAAEPYWGVYEEAVEAEGIQLDIVDFTDYNQPNPATSEGELDINQFQHIIYLANYNVQAGDDLQPIGSTATYPIGLYSSQYDDIEQIPDGGEVIVPNDDTNQARGLLVLQAAGLIALENGGSPYSTVDDVIEAESRVTVSAVDAAITATSLPDVAAAVINNDFLTDAGIDPADALAQDDPTDPAAQPYINIFATTAENADDEVLNRLVEIFQTNEEVQAGALESSGGTGVFVQTPKDELVASLEAVQEALQAQ